MANLRRIRALNFVAKSFEHRKSSEHVVVTCKSMRFEWVKVKRALGRRREGGEVDGGAKSCWPFPIDTRKSWTCSIVHAPLLSVGEYGNYIDRTHRVETTKERYNATTLSGWKALRWAAYRCDQRWLSRANQIAVGRLKFVSRRNFDFIFIQIRRTRTVDRLHFRLQIRSVSFVRSFVKFRFVRTVTVAYFVDLFAFLIRREMASWRRGSARTTSSEAEPSKYEDNEEREDLHQSNANLGQTRERKRAANWA